ncbi:MAG: 5'-nucleotidase C-terminal domain-containing protein [Bacteroidales bacterium]|nr:5'-nucleotidase C-terminal domain-containing protein [Bacteroidales bacterium]
MKRRFSYFIIFLCISLFADAQSSYRLISSERISVDDSYDAHRDASLRRYLAPYQALLDRDLHTVLANATASLQAGDPAGALNFWMVDALFRQMSEHCDEPIDMAVVNNHAFRKALPEGPITMGDMYECIPFENEVVVLKMKASDVMSLMKTIARRGTESFANASIEVKDGRLDKLTINGKAWDKDRVYTIVTIDYLAQGSGGMTAFRRALDTRYTKLFFRPLVCREMENLSLEGKLIRPYVDERFKILP